MAEVALPIGTRRYRTLLPLRTASRIARAITSDIADAVSVDSGVSGLAAGQLALASTVARHGSTRAAVLSITNQSQPTCIYAADTRLIGACNRRQAVCSSARSSAGRPYLIFA